METETKDNIKSNVSTDISANFSTNEQTNTVINKQPEIVQIVSSKELEILNDTKSNNSKKLDHDLEPFPKTTENDDVSNSDDDNQSDNYNTDSDSISESGSKQKEFLRRERSIRNSFTFLKDHEKTLHPSITSLTNNATIVEEPTVLTAVIDGVKYTATKSYNKVQVPKKWTDDEDERLRNAVKRFGEKRWKDIAQMVETRNHVQCLQRWNKVLKQNLKKGHWTAEEDQTLVKTVYRFQTDFSAASEANPKKSISWSIIAHYIPGRTPKQCRERWLNHLDPAVNKSFWSPEEDALLLKLHEQWGNQWASISLQFNGRTQNSVKIRWKTLQRCLKVNNKLLKTDAYSRNTAMHLPPYNDTMVHETKSIPSTSLSTIANAMESSMNLQDSKTVSGSNSRTSSLAMAPLLNSKFIPQTSPIPQSGSFSQSNSFSVPVMNIPTMTQFPPPANGMSRTNNIYTNNGLQMPTRNIMNPNQNIPVTQLSGNQQYLMNSMNSNQVYSVPPNQNPSTMNASYLNNINPLLTPNLPLNLSVSQNPMQSSYLYSTYYNIPSMMSYTNNNNSMYQSNLQMNPGLSTTTNMNTLNTSLNPSLNTPLSSSFYSVPQSMAMEASMSSASNPLSTTNTSSLQDVLASYEHSINTSSSTNSSTLKPMSMNLSSSVTSTTPQVSIHPVQNRFNSKSPMPLSLQTNDLLMNTNPLYNSNNSLFTGIPNSLGQTQLNSLYYPSYNMLGYSNNTVSPLNMSFVPNMVSPSMTPAFNSSLGSSLNSNTINSSFLSSLCNSTSSVNGLPVNPAKDLEYNTLDEALGTIPDYNSEIIRFDSSYINKEKNKKEKEKEKEKEKDVDMNEKSDETMHVVTATNTKTELNLKDKTNINSDNNSETSQNTSKNHEK